MNFSNEHGIFGLSGRLIEPAAAAKNPLHEMDLEVLELYLSVPESVQTRQATDKIGGILNDLGFNAS